MLAVRVLLGDAGRLLPVLRVLRLVGGGRLRRGLLSLLRRGGLPVHHAVLPCGHTMRSPSEPARARGLVGFGALPHRDSVLRHTRALRRTGALGRACALHRACGLRRVRVLYGACGLRYARVLYGACGLCCSRALHRPCGLRYARVLHRTCVLRCACGLRLACVLYGASGLCRARVLHRARALCRSRALHRDSVLPRVGGLLHARGSALGGRMPGGDALPRVGGLPCGAHVLRRVGSLRHGRGPAIARRLPGGDPLLRARSLVRARGRRRAVALPRVSGLPIRHRALPGGELFPGAGRDGRGRALTGERPGQRRDGRRGIDTGGGQARGAGLGEGYPEARESQRHEGLDRGLAPPGSAVAGLEPGAVDEAVLFELDDLFVAAQLPQLHPPPQAERGDGGEQPAGEADAFHVAVGGDVGDPADGVPRGLDGDDEEHRDDRVHADAERVGPGGGAVEGDGGGGEQPGGLAQQGEGDPGPGQEQVQGQEDDDAGVDADGQDVGEAAEAFLEREVAHGGVRTGEADPGDHHRSRHDETDQYAVRTRQLGHFRRGHPRSLPALEYRRAKTGTPVRGGARRLLLWVTCCWRRRRREPPWRRPPPASAGRRRRGTWPPGTPRRRTGR